MPHSSAALAPIALVAATLVASVGRVVPLRAQEGDPPSVETSGVGATSTFYELGLALVEEGRWRDGLALWEDARDELATESVQDPRIGFGYIEVATANDASDLYGTATDMVLWGLSGQPVEGSVEAIHDELERVRMIVPDSQLTYWSALAEGPVDEALFQLKRFWIELDPTPLTSENERLVEHWERIRDARRRFVYNRSSPIGTDDRGRIYVRYGEPPKKERGFLGASEMEMRVRLPGARHAQHRQVLRGYDTNPQFEVWVYDELNDRGFTYFLFGNVDGGGPFELVPGIEDLIPPRARSPGSARNMAGGVPADHYLRLFYYQDLSSIGGYFGDRFGELDRLWNLYTERRRTSVSATGAAPQESELESLEMRFREEDEYHPPNPPQKAVLSEFEGRARDEVVAQLIRTLSDDEVPILVLLSTSAPRLRADRRAVYRDELRIPGWTMRHSLVIRDEELDEVGRLEKPIDPRRADVASFVIRHVEQPLHLTVTAQTWQRPPETDEGAPAADSLVPSDRLPGQVHFRPGAPLDNDTTRLEMSDLLTGTPIPPGVDAAALPYDVLPAQTLWRRDPLRVYMELYHIGRRAGASDLRASFSVVPLTEQGDLDEDREAITLDDVRLEPEGRVYREFFDISLRDQEPGRYRLEVEIIDAIRQQTRRRTTELRLVN